MCDCPLLPGIICKMFILLPVVCLVAQSCLTLCDLMDWSPPGSSVLQARIQEWVAMPSSRGSSQPRDRTQVPRIVGGSFTVWATREALFVWKQTRWTKFVLLRIRTTEHTLRLGSVRQKANYSKGIIWDTNDSHKDHVIDLLENEPWEHGHFT